MPKFTTLKKYAELDKSLELRKDKIYCTYCVQFIGSDQKGHIEAVHFSFIIIKMCFIFELHYNVAFNFKKPSNCCKTASKTTNSFCDF